MPFWPVIQESNKAFTILKKKWAKDLSSHCSREDLQVTNEHMERCTALSTGEMQLKTTVKFTPTAMTIAKKAENHKCW